MDTITDLVNVSDGAMYAVATGLVISMALQSAKRWFNLQSDKVITFLLAAFAFIAAAVEYLLTIASQDPSILGQNTAMLVGIATVAYRYAVKPVSQFLHDVKEYRLRENRLQAEAAPITDEMPIDDGLVEAMETMDSEPLAIENADIAESVTPVPATTEAQQ